MKKEEKRKKSEKSEEPIKITEIPSKVTEIKILTKEESELEREVEEPEEDLSSVQTSNRFFTPTLEQTESAQQAPRIVEIARKDEKVEGSELFSENVRYSAPSAEFTESARARQTQTSRGYVTPEQASARINPSINSPGSGSVAFTSMNARPRGDFEADELKRLRGEKEDRNYNEPLDIRGDAKTRNKLPWEI